MKINSNHSSIVTLLNRADALLQQGALGEASKIYRQLLEKLPQNSQLLSTLGMLLLQLGELPEGVQRLGESLGINPNQPHVLANMGLALRSLGDLERALECCELAIALMPSLSDAYNNRGLILKDLGRPSDALASFDGAIASHPDFVQAYNNRGIVLRDVGRLDEAVDSFKAAIERCSDFAEAYNNLSNVLRELHRLDEALAYIDEAFKLNPNNPEIHNNRSLVFRDLRRFDEALASSDRAIALNPCYADAFNNRGNILGDLGRLNEAVESFDSAISLNERYADAYYNRGIVLDKLGRLEDALRDYEHVVMLAADHIDAHCNRGNVLKELNRLLESEAAYNQAIKLKPQFASANWNKALLKLLKGDFASGWPLYEWRWRGPQLESVRAFEQPLWLGNSPIEGKRLLVYPEQGLGDYIQMCRYVPLLIAQGAKVILEVPASLLPLVRTLEADVELVGAGEVKQDFDLQCPIMSLPLALGTTLDAIPAKIPYLFIDESKQKFWRERLGKKCQGRIGLAWSGSRQHTNDHNRSLPLPLLEPLLSLPFEFHSLQKEIRPEDLDYLKQSRMVILHEQELHDFSDTAALIQEMDLVISVDTSVAHLAGALGQKVWLLLPYAPDFRWLLDRPDSPWYPTATLFRQAAVGDWSGVVTDVVAELGASFSGGTQTLGAASLNGSGVTVVSAGM